MKFARIAKLAAEVPVVLDGDRAWDLDGINGDITPAFLATSGLAPARTALEAGRLPELADASDRHGARIASTPATVCIGQKRCVAPQ